MAICSASTKDACLFVLDNLLGQENLSKFDLVLAGDDVPRRKPDPMIYALASEKLGVPPERWVGRGRDSLERCRAHANEAVDGM